jgi:Peptidase family M28
MSNTQQHSQHAGSPPAREAARADQDVTAPARPAWHQWLASVAMVVVVLAAGVAAYLPFTQTPSVRPADAPATVFSAERAMTQLEAVASRIRPMGSSEHEQSVAAIRTRLSKLGVESQVVNGTVTRNDFGQVFAGRLRNVIARIPGTDSSGAVALLSHFDSVPTSMNANDGGVGVATILETVRAIKAGPPLKNDLVLWFGDADETTALNALLLQRHPWFADVRFGVAFEAPGVEGRSVLTFAGQGNPDATPPLLSLGANEGVSLSNSAIRTDNGRWLREALDAVPGAVVALPVNDIALGASPDLGMSMWGTDVAGVSFSQVGDSSGYHTMLDRPDRASLGSLQDSGNTAVALTRHFGALDLTDVPATNGVVAFTVAPRVTLHYPATAAVPLALLTLVGLILAVALAWRRRRLGLGSLVLGTLVTVLTVAAAAACAVLLTSILAPDAHFARNPYGVGWRILIVVTATLTVVSGVFLGTVRLLKRDSRGAGLTAGPVVVTTLLAVLTAATAPALSYVFLWPAMAAVALLAWQQSRDRDADPPWATAAALALVGAVVVMVGVPVVYLLSSAASIALPTFAAVVAVFTALLAAVLVPHYRQLSGRRWWTVPVVLLAATATCIVGLQATSGYGPDQPRPDYIQYTLDADTGQATWLSAGTSPDGWTRQFFADGYTSSRQAFSPGYFFDQKFDVIQAPAPAVALAPPRLRVLADSTANGVRSLRLRLTSQRGAPTAHLDLTLPGDLVSASVDGQNIKIGADTPVRRLPLTAYNLGTRGMTVTLLVRSRAPITGTLTDYSSGLPHIPGTNVQQRSGAFLPAPFDFRDPTAVRTSITL